MIENLCRIVLEKWFDDFQIGNDFFSTQRSEKTQFHDLQKCDPHFHCVVAVDATALWLL